VQTFIREDDSDAQKTEKKLCACVMLINKV